MDPFYVSGALGLSPTGVGLAMAAGPIASIVSGVLAGRLVDRGLPTRLMAAGLLVMTAAAAALALLPPLAGQAAATADALDSGLRLVFGIAAVCLAAACLASFAGKRRR
ncbi:MAG: hypothetical protein AB7V10_00310 [Leucobacter sp.]